MDGGAWIYRSIFRDDRIDSRNLAPNFRLHSLLERLRLSLQFGKICSSGLEERRLRTCGNGVRFPKERL